MRISAIDVTAERPYQVVVGQGALELLPQYVAEQGRIAVIHPPVLREQASKLRSACDCQTLSIEVPAAEAAKTGETLQRCWDALAEAGFTRSDAIIGLGGERPPIWPVSSPPPGCAASPTCRCRPRCWAWWTPPSAARPEST